MLDRKGPQNHPSAPPRGRVEAIAFRDLFGGLGCGLLLLRSVIVKDGKLRLTLGAG